MDNVYIGKIVATHGIKGELKIISDFPFKDKVFVVGKSLLIDGEKYVIKSYRHHKIYDMVTLNDFKDINEVEFLLRRKVYVLKDDLELAQDEILDDDLLKFKVVVDDVIDASIKEITMASPTNKIIKVDLGGEILVLTLNHPNIKFDFATRTIYVYKRDGVLL